MTDDRTSTRRSAWGLSSGNHPEPWWNSALCREVGSELFFVNAGESAAPAKKVCGLCDVRAECLADALTYNDYFGVRGGLSERERRALQRGQPVTQCRLCGNNFVCRTSDQTRTRYYCSDDCRVGAHRIAKREHDQRRREGAA